MECRMKKCIKYKLIKMIKKIFKIKSPSVIYTSHFEELKELALDWAYDKDL